MTACLKILIHARLLIGARRLEGSRNGNIVPCRLWCGGQSRGGQRPKSDPYGSIWIPGHGTVRTHVAAAWVAGVIPGLRVPAGMHLDHTCERPLCIEPSHFDLVPGRLNLERRWTRRQAA